MTKQEAIKYLQQLYPIGGHCWLDEQRIEAISMAIKALQEEPVSNDLEREIKHYVYDPYFDLNGVAVKGATDYLTVEDVADIARHFVQWQKEQMITKACNYLFSHMGLLVTFFDDDIVEDIERSEFIKKFRIAMEDKV